MAEETDKDDKTEEASAHKLAEAQKKGDVARTPDLSAALSVAFVCSVILLAGPSLLLNLVRIITPFLDRPHALLGSLRGDGGLGIFQAIIMGVLPVLIAVMGAAMIGGVGGHALQGGIICAPDKLKPDFKKLNPIKGFDRLFGVDALMQFAKTFVKLVVTGILVWWAIKPRLMEMATLSQLAPTALLSYAHDIFLILTLWVCLFLVAGAGLDYLWQKYRFMDRMKMSKQEVKDEHRQIEGDPMIKARLRAIRMEKARRRMMANVANATVVITNPTHYAVALRYDPKEQSAPICLAKGVDDVALRIRAEAAKHEISIIEDPPLARALYASVELDEVIDESHFQAVAKIIGFVLERKKRRSF